MHKSQKSPLFKGDLGGSALLHNAQSFVHSIEAGTLVIPPPPSDIATWPAIGQPLNKIWQQASVNLEGVISQFKPQIQEFAKTLLVQATNTGLTLLKFVVSIIIAAILLLYAEGLNRGLIRFVSHLSPSQGGEFLNLATTTIRSVTQGRRRFTALSRCVRYISRGERRSPLDYRCTSFVSKLL